MPDWEGKARCVLDWRGGEQRSLHTLEIHLTFRCNLRCVFCDQADRRRRNKANYSKEVSGERWLELIEEAAQLGVQEVGLCGGGEPMYDTLLARQLFRKIKEKGMRGYLTTNGTLFTDELCSEIVTLGWDKIELAKVRSQMYGLTFSEDILVESAAKKTSCADLANPIFHGKRETREQDSVSGGGRNRLARFISSPCYEPWDYLQILYDGTSSPCCNAYRDPSEETIRDSSLESVWISGTHLNRVREELILGKLAGKCGTCDAVREVKAHRIRQSLLPLCEQRGLMSGTDIAAFLRRDESCKSEAM